MKIEFKPTLSAIAMLFAVTSASAADLRETQVMTHPSQGEVTAVPAAVARLSASDTGVFVNIDTSGLEAGHVHTLWLVAINNPAECEDGSCTSKDVLKRTREVDADVGYAGGVITGSGGEAHFAYFQPEGELNNAWFSAGLREADSAEIHLIINDHGPLLAGREQQMLSSYREGCKDESIPAPMPDTARAHGTAGPNSCRLVQFAVFEAPEPQS